MDSSLFTPQEISPSPTNVANSGRRLRVAREARQLEVEDVAQQLRLQVRHIQALESQDLAQLPGASYVCGYLRAYAKLLDLPSDEIVENFPGIGEHLSGVRSTRMPTQLLPEGDYPRMRPKNSLPSVVILIAIVVTAGWLAYEMGWWGVSPLTTTPTSLSGGTDSTPPPSGSTVEQPSEPSAGGPAAQGEQVDQSAAMSQATSELADIVPALPPSTPISELIVQFKGDCWVEVYDGENRRLIYQMAKAGQTIALKGEAPFKLSLGAAAQVSIVYNGAPFDMAQYKQREAAALEIGQASDNRMPATGE